MRVLIDACRARIGGVATYATNVVEAWAKLGDDLHVYSLARNAGRQQENVTRHCVTSTAGLGAVGAQFVALSRAVHALKPDVVVSLVPQINLLLQGVPAVAVVHDFRDELLSGQFSLATRMLRKIAYGRAYRGADMLACVSQQTRHNLRILHPEFDSKASVVHHGGNHVMSWGPAIRRSGAIAFAHHNNKAQSVVLDAWALLQGMTNLPHLHIVGSNLEAKEAMRRRMSYRGLTDAQVTLHEYLPEAKFQSLFAACQLVVFPSEHEGFGLPALEAQYLRIPLVVSSDPALQEVTGGLASTASSCTPHDVADAIMRALEQPREALDRAFCNASNYTWARSAALLRDVADEAIRRSTASSWST